MKSSAASRARTYTPKSRISITEPILLYSIAHKICFQCGQRQLTITSTEDAKCSCGAVYWVKNPKEVIVTMAHPITGLRRAPAK